MIILILFVITLVNFITYLRTRKMPNALFCGLWCYVGDTVAVAWRLKILALYNQARGDHATGVCIDGHVFKEVTDAKAFLYKHYDIFEFDKYQFQNFAVLGHCRQATSAYSKDNLLFAHPHAVKRAPDDKDPFLYFVHNGTLTNCWDLAQKYDVDWSHSDCSDSMLLARMIAKTWDGKSMEPLVEYEGSATVVFYPKNVKNTLYVHRDKARELYYWQETKGSCYISSVKEALLAIGASGEEVIEFEDGILYKFHDGRIVKEWDLKVKSPYSKPRVSNSKIHPTNVPFQQRIPICGYQPQISNGFLWRDHRLYYNGHLYIGHVYIHKATGAADRFAPKIDKINYDEYWVIMGLFMKNLSTYTALYKHCVIADEFKAEEFKKLIPSELEQFSKYPVLGKIFDKDGSEFFWSDELPKIASADTYVWSPPLSNMTFKTNKAGFLLEKKTNRAESSPMETIEYIINKKMAEGGFYTNAIDLFDNYQTHTKAQTNAGSWDNFADKLIDVIEKYGFVNSRELHDIERSRQVEDYAWTNNEVYTFNTLLNDALVTTLNGLKTIGKNMNSYPPAEEDEPVDDHALHGELAEQLMEDYTSEAEHYGSQSFKNDLLFGNYDNFDKVIEDYMVTDAERDQKTLYAGVLNLFGEIGLMADNELATIKTQPCIQQRSTVKKAFENLKEEKLHRRVFDMFESGDANIHGAFAELYNYRLVLDNKRGRSTEEEVNLNLLELALKYLSSNKEFNRGTLLKEYNITNTEIAEVCQ